MRFPTISFALLLLVTSFCAADETSVALNQAQAGREVDQLVALKVKASFALEKAKRDRAAEIENRYPVAHCANDCESVRDRCYGENQLLVLFAGGSRSRHVPGCKTHSCEANYQLKQGPQKGIVVFVPHKDCIMAIPLPATASDRDIFAAAAWTFDKCVTCGDKCNCTDCPGGDKCKFTRSACDCNGCPVGDCGGSCGSCGVQQTIQQPIFNFAPSFGGGCANGKCGR